METWAHSQAIYDTLGKIRKNKDRILNIVIIGNNTFNWTYKVNKKEIPFKKPYLKLLSPSGKIWEFNDYDNSEKIEGLAEEFCQVVTQVRNIKDLNLKLNEEKILSSLKEISSSEESLRLSRLRYDVGISTLKDVLIRQKELSDANSKNINAIYNYNLNLDELERLTYLEISNICNERDSLIKNDIKSICSI